ncbi:MAG: ATP-binding cassette domain-containing protein [Thermoleophilia bacterium]|nr:ATP-binding cassette domain-containing protein [Thermoleophilia bacterium]
MLIVEHLTIRYGAVAAVRDLSFALRPGEAVTLLGANGAGKTSTLLALMGVVRPQSGTITLAGDSLLGLSPRWSLGGASPSSPRAGTYSPA